MKRSHAIALGATGIILAGAWLGGSGNQRVDSSAPAADSGTDARIFTSLDECLQANRPLIPDWKHPDGTTAKPGDKGPGQLICDSDFKAATEKHVTTAPKFAKEDECAKEYGAGQCRSTTFNGTSVFVPAMVGFMVANYLSNQRNAQALLPARQGGAIPCPPDVTPVQQPGCLMPRQSTTNTTRHWRSYSTSSGHTVSHDTSMPAGVPAKVPTGAASAPVARTSLGAAPVHALTAPRSASTSSSSRSSWFGSSSRSSSSSSSSSVSRGGFGSSGRSMSSSS